MNRDLESVLDGLVNVAKRAGAWTVEGHETSGEITYRLAAELGTARQRIRTLFAQRVDMPEVTDFGPVGPIDVFPLRMVL